MLKTWFVMFAIITLGRTAMVTGYQVAPGSKQQYVTVVSLDLKESHFAVADLDKLPQQEVSLKNEDESTTKYSGTKLRALLDQVGVPGGEKLRGDALQQVVVVTARDGYSVPFTVTELDPTFGDLNVLLVYRKDGKQLPHYQGPFRLLVPSDKAGARSVRMVQTIRVATIAAEKDGP